MDPWFISGSIFSVRLDATESDEIARDHLISEDHHWSISSSSSQILRDLLHTGTARIL